MLILPAAPNRLFAMIPLGAERGIVVELIADGLVIVTRYAPDAVRQSGPVKVRPSKLSALAGAVEQVMVSANHRGGGRSANPCTRDALGAA
jgi:hypothetical protein